MKKRLLTSILAASLLATSFAACTPSESSTSTPSDNSSQSESDSKEPITLSMFIDHTWFWFDKWGDDFISQEITKLTGVSLDVTRATDGNQLALLINGGDLPDLVYTGTLNTMNLLSDPEICYSYNELIDKYKVDIFANETEIANNTAADGNYYCLLNAYTSEESARNGESLTGPGTRSIAYRTDIYEELGSPDINTLEDLENVLLAAKEKHPDIIPLLVSPGYEWYFADQLGLNGGSSIGYDKDGKPCYSLDMEGIKDYYALLNRFAREGLITAESFTYSNDQFIEVRNSGKSFMQLRSCDEAIGANNAAKETGSGYQWKLLTNELSDKMVYVNTGVGFSGVFITKNNKDPQRSIEFMSWCRSEEGRKLTAWGREGIDWEYNDEGKTVYTEEYNKAIAEGKQKQNDFGIGVWIFGDRGDENAFVDYGATDPDQKDYIARQQSAAKNYRAMPELYFCTPVEGDMLNIWTSLNDMMTSETKKVIFAESEEAFEEAYNNMYQMAQEMGMAELNQWMEGQLEAYQAKLNQ